MNIHKHKSPEQYVKSPGYANERSKLTPPEAGSQDDREQGRGKRKEVSPKLINIKLSQALCAQIAQDIIQRYKDN